MSFFQEILSIQRPFNFSSDANSRPMFSCNFEALAEAPIEQWAELLASILVAAGAATAIGTDIFIGTGAVIPDGDGPYISILDTGGASVRYTQNDDKQERLSAQIVVRAAKYRTARTRALAVWRAIEGTRNATVTA